MYSWRGERIPDEWIESPETLTATVAITWDNVEQRRCACEILGWETVLRELGCQVIDTNPTPLVGQLVEVEIPGIGPEKFLRALCGTGRVFALPVPPTMETALQANALINNCSEENILNLEVRT